jgi:hypothetical protein
VSLVVRFLRRSGARPTWQYEALAVLAVELVCVLAVMAVTPVGPARLTAIVAGGLSLLAAEAARVRLSVETRRREEAERRGLVAPELHCDADVRRAQWILDVISWIWPAAPTVIAAAAAGSFALPSTVATATVFVRLLRDRVAYPAWRRWWLRRRAEPAAMIAALEGMLAVLHRPDDSEDPEPPELEETLVPEPYCISIGCECGLLAHEGNHEDALNGGAS